MTTCARCTWHRVAPLGLVLPNPSFFSNFAPERLNERVHYCIARQVSPGHETMTATAHGTWMREGPYYTDETGGRCRYWRPPVRDRSS